MCENCLHMKNLKYRLKLFVGKTAEPIFQLLATATVKIFKIFAKRMRCEKEHRKKEILIILVLKRGNLPIFKIVISINGSQWLFIIH